MNAELNYSGANAQFFQFRFKGYWQVAHKWRFMCHLSASPVPKSGKTVQCPKVIQHHLLNTLLSWFDMENYLGQASAATIIRCPFNLAACRVSIRILGIFFSAGTKMCFVALLPDGFSCSIPQYWRHFRRMTPTTRPVVCISLPLMACSSTSLSWSIHGRGENILGINIISRLNLIS